MDCFYNHVIASDSVAISEDGRRLFSGIASYIAMTFGRNQRGGNCKKFFAAFCFLLPVLSFVLKLNNLPILHQKNK